MGDADRGEVGNDRPGLVERKITIQLQSVSGARDLKVRLHDSRNHTTDQGGSVPSPASAHSSVTSSLA